MSILDRMDAEHRAVVEAIPTGFLDLSQLAKTRNLFNKTRREMRSGKVPKGMKVKDYNVPGPEGSPQVMVRLYTPENLSQNTPALFWIHGGGMVLSAVEHDDELCMGRAARLKIPVASVEYRLAPEYPFPAPLEDCYAGLKWFCKEADSFGIDPNRIAIGGASAGGGLAAGLALLVRDRSEIKIAFQLLVYPMIDDRNQTESSQRILDPRLWNRQANILGWNAYLNGTAGEEGVSPYAAPARATDLEGLPPTYINVGDLDLFLDENIDYARKLLSAGVPTEIHVYPGAFHGSNMFVSRSSLSKRWRDDEQEALKRALFE
ncbi:alpha/beta hydrolase [Myxococcota bacterium]|nr:alpha/beta hydrolase [Myxococcota bacterium]